MLVEALITKKTKLIWVETPTNPIMNVVDIKAISALGNAHKIVVARNGIWNSKFHDANSSSLMNLMTKVSLLTL